MKNVTNILDLKPKKNPKKQKPKIFFYDISIHI